METGDLAPSDNEEIVSFKNNESELNRHKRMPSMVRAETNDQTVTSYQQSIRTSVFDDNRTNRGRTESIPNHYNSTDEKKCTLSKIYYHPGMMSFSILIISGLMITCFLISNGELIWNITGFLFLGILLLYLASLAYKYLKNKRRANQKAWSPKNNNNNNNDIENNEDDDDQDDDE